MDHLYSTHINVSIRSEDELRRLLNHSKLHTRLSELSLRYISPFNGMTRTEEGSVRIDLVDLLAPFQKLTSLRVVGNVLRPSQAHEHLGNRKLEAFKSLVLREPRNLIIKRYGREFLAHIAVIIDELEIVQFLAELAPWR
jgi:hypothetical protein